MRTLHDEPRANRGRQRLSKRYRELQALAERDGGWFCFYCQHPLADEQDPANFVLERYECPGGHFDVYPCNQGCNEPRLLLATGLRWAQRDHVLPRSRGGSDNLVNLVLACGDCNNRKGARTPGEWLAA
jgi:5-methylcytosine-specific restriction endonuclease McrA